MKCGLIWARRARTSASIVRVRGASRSASSSLGGHPPGHLLRRPGESRRRGRTVCRDGRHDAVGRHDGGDHRSADRAVGVGAAHLPGAEDDRVSGAQDLLRVGEGAVGVVVGGAVPGQQGGRVGDGDGR